MVQISFNRPLGWRVIINKVSNEHKLTIVNSINYYIAGRVLNFAILNALAKLS